MSGRTTEVRWPQEPVQPIVFSEEEQKALVEKMAAIDKLFKDKKLAKYKLEVLFDEERSFHKPFGGTVTWWESGSKLHGGGDAKLYLCPGKERKNNGCEAFIPDSAHGMTFLVCSSCGSLWKREEVWGEVWYRLSMQSWADVLLSWFIRLELNADIRIKYFRDDIRTVAMREQERQRGGELLRTARGEERRSTSSYPLSNIIKDTSAGASLQNRILAFLRS